MKVLMTRTISHVIQKEMRFWNGEDSRGDKWDGHYVLRFGTGTVTKNRTPFVEKETVARAGLGVGPEKKNELRF